MLRPGELLIHDGMSTAELRALCFAYDPGDGRVRGRGHDPSQVVKEMFDAPSGMPLIPRSEWSQRLKDKIAEKSLNSDRRLEGNNGQAIPSLDQGQVGYCWAHSTTHAIMLSRALSNQPYVPLSAYAVAATIKRGADEGGWCGLSAQFARDKGIPAQSLWPQGDRNYRAHDKPEVWTNAALHKTTEEWVDLAKSVYDQNLTFDQWGSGLIGNLVGPEDHNFWSHSICGLDIVEGATARATYRLASGKLPQLHEFDLHWGMNHPVTGGFGVRIWNSWSDTWSDRGMGTLAGSKAIPDSCLLIRSTTVSQAE
jgi:hypothetical protein